MALDTILKTALERGASDVHISEWEHPETAILFRMEGRLVPFPIKEETMITVRETFCRWRREGQLDFARPIFGTNARFRANLFMTCLGEAAALRILRGDIPTLDVLHVLETPAILRKLCHLSHGLVLICGATGMGKTSTLAAMIEEINQTSAKHIITLEDPVEYRFQSKKALIRQREIGTHVHSFLEGLRAALREDPDIIMVGEMRDKETVATVLQAAETGHLVLSTLHTSSVSESIDRLLQYFPGDQQEPIRMQFANCMQGVVVQQLLPRRGQGRAAAAEIMLRTPATVNLIRTNQLHKVRDTLAYSDDMQNMADIVSWLKEHGVIEESVI